MRLPKELTEGILKLKGVVEKFHGTLLLQFIFIKIPEVTLDIIYKLVHVRQREDLLKTHLDSSTGSKRKCLYFFYMICNITCGL